MSHNFSQKFLNRSFSNFKAFERICYLKSFQKNHHLSKSVKKCGSYSDFSFWISTCGSWSNFFYKNRKFISQPILTNEYFSESSRRVDYFYEIIFIKMSHFQKIFGDESSNMTHNLIMCRCFDFNFSTIVISVSNSF